MPERSGPRRNNLKALQETWVRQYKLKKERMAERGGPPGYDPMGGRPRSGEPNDRQTQQRAYEQYYEKSGDPELQEAFQAAQLLSNEIGIFLAFKQYLSPEDRETLMAGAVDYFLGRPLAEKRLREQSDPDGWLYSWLMRHQEYLAYGVTLGQSKLVGRNMWPKWLTR